MANNTCEVKETEVTLAMKLKTLFCALAAVLCLGVSALQVSAAEVECDTAYCFSAADFSTEENLTGICITGLPDPQTGTVIS